MKNILFKIKRILKTIYYKGYLNKDFIIVNSENVKLFFAFRKREVYTLNKEIHDKIHDVEDYYNVFNSLEKRKRYWKEFLQRYKENLILVEWKNKEYSCQNCGNILKFKDYEEAFNYDKIIK